MPDTPAARKKVLVVDDDRAVQRLVELILRDRQMDVTIAPSAEEALLLASRTIFDLVVVDKNLPGMSGIELVGKLHASSPKTALALITAEMTFETPARLKELGVDAILAKPFVDPAAIGERLAGLARRRSTPPAASPAR